MKKKLILLSSLVSGILILTGCGGGGGGSSTAATTSSTGTNTGTSSNNTSTTNTSTTTTDTTTNTTSDTISKNITISDDYQVESLGKAKNIHATVSLGNTPKDLYIVLSNAAATSSSSTISHNAKLTASVHSKLSASQHSRTLVPLQHSPKYVQDFSARLNTLLKKSPESEPNAKTVSPSSRNDDVSGESKSFYLDANGLKTTTATARKIIANIETNYGTKTLNIWVSDDSFDSGSGCSKSRCVTQSMVDALADTFLTAGPNNDVYDWVTNIYENEWGNETNGYSGLIGNNNEITILLTDIDNDNNPEGGAIGFFWSKDNFTKSSIAGSNERIMFYADSVMFANGENGWDMNDPWPKEMVSTLAHEFQHMINFYQKRILLDTDIDTWINEMLSETTEDIVATKIEHYGPRGVDETDGSAGGAGNTKGRYPLFNESNTLSLTTWNNRLEDYSKVNAFGTFLIRNYGGAQLLHDIMHNSYEDKNAIVDAVHKSAEGTDKTFADLLREWGIAVLLSNIESPENLPTYNTGDFMYSTYNGTTYEMGSINFFNYDPLPTIYTIANSVEAEGNYYYSVGENLTGDITISLELNGDTEATLVAK